MLGITKLRWGLILLSAVIAEIVPILVLVAITIVYVLIRAEESPTPEVWAPLAGKWVGPIGGFLATLIMSRWCAQRADYRLMAHGLAVGIGTALLDIVVGFSLGGSGALESVFVASNMGRIFAGSLGGLLITQSNSSKAT